MVRSRKSDEFRPSGFSFSQWISAPFRKLMELISDDSESIHRSPSQQFWHVVRSILWAPVALLWIFFGFLLTSWSSSRSGWAFLWGLPALLTASGLFLSIGIANHFYRNIVLNRYEGSANNMLSLGNAEGAALCLSRLVREQPDEPRYQFSLAIANEQMDKEEECMAIMEKLAPLDRPGFLQAHQWMANKYFLDEDSEVSEEVRMDLARQHLEMARKVDGVDLRVRMQLAFIHEKRGEFEDAIRLFRSVVDYQFPPDAEVSTEYQVFLAQAGPPLIKLYVEEKQLDEARRTQQTVIRKLRNVTATDPDNLDAWRLIVLCQLETKDYVAATQTISEAQVSARTGKIRMQLTALLADLFIEYADEMENAESGENFTYRFRAIAQAVELNHRNPRAIDRLISLCISPHSESAETEKRIRISASSSTIAPLVLNVTLASRAAIAGRTEEAFAYLKIADEMGPLAATIVNTISIKLYFEPVDRPDDALRLINLAMEVWPDIPNLNYTRGEIFYGIGRIEDALVDFNHAVQKLPNHIPLRQSLIKVNEELGNMDEVSAHKNELQRLKEEFNLSGDF